MRSVCYASVDACGVFATLVWMHAECLLRLCGCMRSIAEAHEISERFRRDFGASIRSDRALFSTDMPRVMTIGDAPRVLTSLATGACQDLVSRGIS
jgi:hypothetical protein